MPRNKHMTPNYDLRNLRPGSSMFFPGEDHRGLNQKMATERLRQLGWEATFRTMGCVHDYAYLNHTVERPEGSGVRVWAISRQRLTDTDDPRFWSARIRIGRMRDRGVAVIDCASDGLEASDVRDLTVDLSADNYRVFAVQDLRDGRARVTRRPDLDPADYVRPDKGIFLPEVNGGRQFA